MDWISIREKAGEFWKKYKYGLLILLLGLLLMWFPGKSEEVQTEPPETVTIQEPDSTAQLEQILSQIEGVGKVKVMLTQATGEEMLYQTDDDRTESDDSVSDHSTTVIVTDANREEAGLIRQVNPPIYLGAIVVCQGADRPSVRLAVAEAVSNVTGLGTDRISILKMK